MKLQDSWMSELKKLTGKGSSKNNKVITSSISSFLSRMCRSFIPYIRNLVCCPFCLRSSVATFTGDDFWDSCRQIFEPGTPRKEADCLDSYLPPKFLLRSCDVRRIRIQFLYYQPIHRSQEFRIRTAAFLHVCGIWAPKTFILTFLWRRVSFLFLH